MEDNFEREYQQLYQDFIGDREDIEQEIEEVSSYIAQKINHGDKKPWCEFQDDIYEFRIANGIKDWKEITLLIAMRYPDSSKKDNGRIYKVEIEKDKNLSAEENIRYAVKGLFQHILGIIQPEEEE